MFLPHKNSFNQQNKILFHENSSSALTNQSLALSLSSEVDNIIQGEEAFLKKNPTVGLPEVSKLIDSAISKRQGDRRKHSFLERKKNTAKKGKWIHYEHPEYHITGWTEL